VLVEGRDPDGPVACRDDHDREVGESRIQFGISVLEASDGRHVRGGQPVKDEAAEPSRTLFVVADTSGMWLTLRVRPEDANRILPGQPVRFRHPGHVGPADWDPGEVVWISPAADEKTRMVPVRVQLDPGAASPGTHRVEFIVSAVGVEGIVVREKSVFMVR